MVELQKNKQAFDEHDIRIIAASVDPVEKARAMAERTKAAFTFLSDEKGELIEYFKIWYHRPERTDISIASSFLYDRSGKLVWQNITDDYKVRPKPELVLAAAEAHRNAAKK